MNILIKLLSPVLINLGEFVLSHIIIYIKQLIDDWKFAKKQKEDDKKIDEAFKNPDRGKAARDLNDVFKG